MRRLHLPLHIDLEILDNTSFIVEKVINLKFDNKLIEDAIIENFRKISGESHPIALIRSSHHDFDWVIHQCILLGGHWYLQAMVFYKEKYHHGFVECSELEETADNISIDMFIKLIDKVICQALVDLCDYPVVADISRILEGRSD